MNWTQVYTPVAGDLLLSALVAAVPVVVLLGLLAAHRADPHIGASFPLDEAATALRYVADGRAIGKVVVDVSASDHSGH